MRHLILKDYFVLNHSKHSFKLSLDFIILLLWDFLILCRSTFGMTNAVIDIPSHFGTIFSSLGIILLTSYYVIKKHVYFFVKSKTTFLLYFLMIISLFFGIVVVNPLLSDLIAFNLQQMVLFYPTLFLVSFYVARRLLFDALIKNTYFVFVLLLFIQLIGNYKDCTSLCASIENLFLGFERYRVDFGFLHPNVVGNICVCSILMSVYLFAEVYRLPNQKSKRIMIILCDSIIFYMILATASRTSVYILLISFFYFIYYKVIRRIMKRKMLVAIICIIVCLFIFLSTNSFSLRNFLYHTNRLDNFIKNIPILIDSGRFLIGLGYIGSGDFLGLRDYNTYYVDNFYLYILMSTGMIGFICFSCIIIIIFCRLRKSYYRNIFEKKYILTIFILNLIAAFFETSFLYPSFASCYVYCVSYFTILYHSEMTFKNYSIKSRAN